MQTRRTTTQTISSYSIPNIILKSAFRLNGRALHISHVNGGSIYPNIDKFRRIYENSGAHVIAVSETWFKSYTSNISISINGYDVLRNDRVGKRSGGVALYVKKGIKTKIVSASHKLKSEYLFVELIFPNYKILMAVYYKAPKVDEISALNDVLSELMPKYADVILLGDFNENMLVNVGRSCRTCVQHTCKTCRFKSVMNTFGLSSIGTQPTNFDQTPSQIDLMLSNNPSSIMRFGQVSSTLSNHDILFASYSNQHINFEEKPRFWRNLKAINMDDLYNDALNSRFDEVLGGTDVNEMTEGFISKLVHLLDTHAPLKRYYPKPDLISTELWYTQAIDMACVDAEVAKRDYKANRTPAKRSLWHRLRNKSNELIRHAKANFYGPKLNPNLGTKQLWHNARGLGLVSSKKDLARPGFTADDFNLHTTTVHTSTIPSRGQLHNVNNVSNRTFQNCFAFRNVLDVDVATALWAVKSNAVGLDKIPLKFLKILSPVILPYLTHIMNFAITSAVFPKVWKSAKTFPVHKKTNSYNLNDYRAISILPAMSKVLEILLKWQMQEFLHINDLSCDNQSGFRKGHSTTTALLKVTSDIKIAMDKRLTTVLLLLDFSKAFDSVDHHVLCGKLRHQFNFDSTAIKLIMSYLSEREQAVCIDGVLSAFLPILKGVPAGTVLGPILFSLFINDIPDSIQHMMYHIFADDVQVYKSFNHADSVKSIEEINRDLKSIEKWAKDNKIQLNASKSQAIAVSVNSETRFLPPIWLNGLIIPYSDSVKNLGMKFNKKLDWSDHIGFVCDKIYKGLRSLWPHYNNTPQAARIHLAKSLLVPHIEYCSVVFSYGISSASKSSLDRAFGSIVRYAYGIRKYDSISQHTDRLLGVSLNNFFKYRTLLFLHKLIHTKTPKYLNFIVCQGRSARTNQLKIPRHGSQYGKTMMVKGAYDWNLVPMVIRSKRSTKEFSAKCLGYLMS